MNQKILDKIQEISELEVNRDGQKLGQPLYVDETTNNQAVNVVLAQWGKTIVAFVYLVMADRLIAYQVENKNTDKAIDEVLK